MGGATGLDYTAIKDVASFYEADKEDLPMIFQDIRVMEAEALQVMASAKKDK